MTIDTLLTWWPTSGHARFVWGAYGVSFLLLLAEAGLALRQQCRARAQALALKGDDA